MTQEFYSKTQALHEEFEKRELHYIDTERKLLSNIMSKRELNTPLQEYLQKINQREKQNEETYRNIMKQMENIDRHTDMMSLKLENLGMLRSSLTSPAIPNWPSNIGSNLQIYGSAQSFNSKLNNPSFESLEHNVRSVIQTNSVSTQTENVMYCEKCHSLIHGQPRHILENEPPSFLSVQSKINDEPQTIYSIKSQEDSCTLNEIHRNSQFISSSGNSELFTAPSNTDKTFVGKSSKLEQQINEIHSDVLLSKRRSSAENHLESNKSIIENMQNGILRNEEKLTESRHSENENSVSKSPDPDANVDTFVSKSDAESMNNEFDFLESDTGILSSKRKSQVISKSLESPVSDVDVILAKETSIVVEHPNESPLKHKDGDAFHPNPKLDLADNKSETSDSVSAPHSPNISVASDSDSIYGKGSSLKESAAYQALLGNTVVPQMAKRHNSDSESEDEVENVLANVVQRSHVKSKSSKSNKMAETKNDVPSSKVIDSKPVVKGSKPPSLNKPHSKLSKNTRKVLGLDTSSGSEVELVVKPPEKKIDEDDEFDFYD